MSWDDPQLRQAVLKVDGLSVLGGGLPVRHGDELVGAVGVSGSCGMREDQAIAEAALTAIFDALSTLDPGPGGDRGPESK